MVDDKYERLPRAGDSEQQLDMQVLYLAPKPLPTGQAPFSAQQMHQEVNERYLDFGMGGNSMEFAARVALGTLGTIILSWLLTCLLMAWLLWNHRGTAFLETLSLKFFGNWLVWLIVLGFAVIFGCILAYAAYDLTRSPPIRFSRQWREVCYVPEGGQPVIVPWEKLIACVAVERVITEYAATPQFTLRLGFHDEANEQMHWVTHGHASLMLAVSEWEALRVYMEQGPTALPPAPPREHEEGTLAYFYFARDTYKDCWGPISYRAWWLLQLFSGWTLPCHIAEWCERLPRAGLPKVARDWSEPLPPEQWAKPSAELLAQSAAIQVAFAQGLSFPEYFKVSLGAFQVAPEPPPAKQKGKGKRARARAAAAARARNPQTAKHDQDDAAATDPLNHNLPDLGGPDD